MFLVSSMLSGNIESKQVQLLLLLLEWFLTSFRARVTSENLMRTLYRINEHTQLCAQFQDVPWTS